MSKNNVSVKTQKMVLMAILFALIILVTCLPLKTFGFEITLAMIPIAVGAVLMGPWAGAGLGGFYGICSFLQCFGLLCPSPLGAELLSINPFYCVVTCIVPRVLCGLLCGLIYKALAKVDKTKIVSNAVACLSCPLLNTVFFMSSLMLMYGNTDYIHSFMDMLGVYNPFLFVIAFVGLNGIIEAAANFVIATAVSKALQKFIKYN